MNIRGTSKRVCRLCAFCQNGKNPNEYLCTLTKNKTSADGSCSDFKYDIFKYSPSVKNNINRFSKKDFEI